MRPSTSLLRPFLPGELNHPARNTSAAYRIEYAVDALEVDEKGFGAVMPRRLWPGRLQPEGDEAEQLGLRAAGCERDADTARRLGETPGNLQ